MAGLSRRRPHGARGKPTCRTAHGCAFCRGRPSGPPGPAAARGRSPGTVRCAGRGHVSTAGHGHESRGCGAGTKMRPVLTRDGHQVRASPHPRQRHPHPSCCLGPVQLPQRGSSNGSPANLMMATGLSKTECPSVPEPVCARARVSPSPSISTPQAGAGDALCPGVGTTSRGALRGSQVTEPTHRTSTGRGVRHPWAPQPGSGHRGCPHGPGAPAPPTCSRVVLGGGARRARSQVQ